MNNSPAPNDTLLQDVIDKRRAWIKGAMALESSSPSDGESKRVREVIERAQKLRLKLAEDRYFAGLGV